MWMSVQGSHEIGGERVLGWSIDKWVGEGAWAGDWLNVFAGEWQSGGVRLIECDWVQVINWMCLGASDWVYRWVNKCEHKW